MIRLLILTAIVFLLYTLLKRWWRRLRLSAPKKNRRDPSTGGIIDEMVPCHECKTYHPKRWSIKKNELYFCSQQCHEASLKKTTDYPKGAP